MGFFKKIEEIVHATAEWIKDKLTDWWSQAKRCHQPWIKLDFNEHVRVILEKVDNDYFFARSEVRSTFEGENPEELADLQERHIFMFYHEKADDVFHLVDSSPPSSESRLRNLYRLNGGKAHW